MRLKFQSCQRRTDLRCCFRAVQMSSICSCLICSCTVVWQCWFPRVRRSVWSRKVWKLLAKPPFTSVAPTNLTIQAWEQAMCIAACTDIVICRRKTLNKSLFQKNLSQLTLNSSNCQGPCSHILASCHPKLKDVRPAGAWLLWPWRGWGDRARHPHLQRRCRVQTVHHHGKPKHWSTEAVLMNLKNINEFNEFWVRQMTQMSQWGKTGKTGHHWRLLDC